LLKGPSRTFRTETQPIIISPSRQKKIHRRPACRTPMLRSLAPPRCPQ
jgi:hypothetical protein